MNTVKNILICDDNEAVHETIGTYIENGGMAYSSVFDGEEAINKSYRNKWSSTLIIH